MMQPFEILKPIYFQKLIAMRKNYLVSQTYTRGFDHLAETHPIDILVTDYDDLKYAQVHFNAVRGDKYASIIHLDDPVHQNKLAEMIAGDKYAVYWSVIKSSEDMKRRLDSHFKDHVRRYIEKNTTWRISSDTKITPKFEVIFGELFLIIQYNSETKRIKFDVIEKS